MEENKTLKVLRDALAKCRGEKETVALIYCDNDELVSTEAFLGDSEKCAAAIHAMLDRIGEGRATPSECAIAYAMFWGMASADLAHGNAVTAAIQDYKKQIQKERTAKTKGS